MIEASEEYPVIAWWSGGITSAVAVWIAILWYGIENVRIVFIDTRNEHKDTYRFKEDCVVVESQFDSDRTKIEEMYIIVVEFIKWYNQQKVK